jgi:hypothetical protein
VCVVGSDAIFAVYSDDEGPGKTIGTRYDMEKSVHGFGLGVFSDCINTYDAYYALFFHKLYYTTYEVHLFTTSTLFRGSSLLEWSE